MKRIFASCTFLTCIFFSEAQNNSLHSFGLNTLFLGTMKQDNLSYESGGFGINYTFRLNRQLSKISSYSFTLPAAFGINGLVLGEKHFEEGYVYFDIPLLAEINYGLKANQWNENEIGIFGGAGFAYTTLIQKYSFAQLAVSSGLRMLDRLGNSYEIRLQFSTGISGAFYRRKMGISIAYFIE